MPDLVTVRFGDTAYLVPPAIAERVAQLHAAGDAYGALVMARDNHAGAPNIVPPGGKVSVPMMFADHLPESWKEALKEMSDDTTQAELARLRAENAALKAAQGDGVRRDRQGRALLTKEQLSHLATEAGRAHIASESALSNGKPGSARAGYIDRLRNGWRT